MRGEVEGERGVLLDQQDAHFLFLVDAPQDAEDLQHDQRRQAERGLVEQHQARLQHQCTGDGQHLLLAARQRAGLLLDAFLEAREVDEDTLQFVLHPLLVLAGVGCDAEILVDRKRREGAASLRDMGDALADDLFRGHAADVLAVEADRAVGSDHVADRPQRGRLAGAVGAQQGRDATGGNVEGDIVERLRLAVEGLESLNLEKRRHYEVPR